MTTRTRANRNSRARASREETRARIVAAAIELVRERSYQELSVGEIMSRTGLERTIFYRHFDDLGDLLQRAGREAIEGLYEAELDLGAAREAGSADAVRAAMEPPVMVYFRHGPLLRALSEAAASGNEQIAAGQAAMHRRFDELVASSLREFPKFASASQEDVEEIAHALNTMNVAYLLDAFGREPRVTAKVALRTVTDIWTAVILGNETNGGS